MYETAVRITYYDLDLTGRMKLSAILRMVHIAADVDANNLGIGFNTLTKMNMSFILQRFALGITRMPKYDEVVTLRTWPDSVARGTFLRKGDMHDKNGKKLMEWTSLWILFDTAARKILKPSALPVTGPPIEVCQANSNHPPKRGDCDTNIAERFNWCRNKIAGMQNYTGEGGKNNEAPCAEGSSSIMPEKIVLPTPGETPFQLFSEYTHIVRHAEVDTNRHMNNSMYGDLIGNALFPSMEAAESAGDWREVQINYLAETRFGEEIKVSAYRENNQFIVVGDAGGKVSFAAKVLSCCKV